MVMHTQPGSMHSEVHVWIQLLCFLLRLRLRLPLRLSFIRLRVKHFHNTSALYNTIRVRHDLRRATTAAAGARRAETGALPGTVIHTK